jgi:hypothetical protein
MSRWMALLAIAIAACSQPSANPVAHATLSPNPWVEPGPVVSSSSPSTPSISPIPIADLPLSTVAFSCRLPIYTEGTVIEDSFISFPEDTISPSPVASGGLYFDRAYSRWLPVTRSAVSPDGTGYAYIEMGDNGVFSVHLVSVQSGKDISFPETASASGFGAQPQVFDYSADGIYLTQAFEHVWAGVWLFQQPAGSIHQVTDIEVPEVSAGSGVFWYGAVNPADPSPFSTRSSAGILPDEVNRIDIKTSQRSQWLYRAGLGLEVMGVDTAGRPLIRVFAPGGGGIANKDFFDHSASELLLGLNPTSQRSIYKGQLVETLGNPIADSHGVWFGSEQGIYLYTSSGALIKVSDHPGYPANGCF